ncbi:MAG: GNAT family N-acetyltransferase [Rubricoccaceae bacterium]
MRPSDPPPFAVRRHTLAEPAARAAYEALARDSPLASAYAGLGLAERCAAAYGLEAALLSVQPAGAAPNAPWEAGMVAFERRRGPFRVLALPPLVPTTGPLVRTLPAEAAVHARHTPLDALAAHLCTAYDQATLAPAPALTDGRAFAWAGFALGVRYTYLLTVQPGESATAWSESARRLLARHAAAYTVREAPEAAAVLWALAERSYARQGARLGLDPARTQALVAALAAAGDARLFVAERDGTPEAAALVPVCGRHASYGLSGSTPGPAMTVLFAGVLPHLAARGIEVFDLNGANVPGIAEFKRRLGAQLVPVLRMRYVRSPVLRIAQALRMP